MTMESKRRTSLDIIFSSVESSKEQKQRTVLHENVHSMKDMVDNVMTMCLKKGVRTIIPIGLDSWGGDKLKNALEKQIGDRFVVTSADHFFYYTSGDYKFDATKIREAHNASRCTYMETMYNPNKICYISNNMVSEYDFKHYTKYPFIIAMFIPSSKNHAIKLAYSGYMSKPCIREKYDIMTDSTKLSDHLVNTKYPHLKGVFKMNV